MNFNSGFRLSTRILFALGTLVAAPSAHAQSLAAGGVALGMSQAEVKGALGSDFAPGVEDRPLSDFVGMAPPGSPSLQVMFAESNDTSKRYTVFFQADKAIIVGFRRVYERNAAPTLDNLQAALVQKYGPMTNSAGPMFHWAFNADGDLITDKSDQCYYRSLADDGPRAGPGDPRTDGFPAATGFTVGNRIGCAKTIFAWAGNGATTTWLIDGQVFTDANKAAEKADAEARAARQRAHEQVKPDL